MLGVVELLKLRGLDAGAKIKFLDYTYSSFSRVDAFS